MSDSSFIDRSTIPHVGQDSSCMFAATYDPATGIFTPLVGFDNSTPGASNTVYAQDAGGIPVTWGISGAPFTSADQSGAVAAVTNAAAASKKLVITDLVVSVDSAMLVTFSEETSGTVMLAPIYMGANTTVNIVTRGKLKLPTAVKKLMVRTSASGNITVSAGHYDEA